MLSWPPVATHAPVSWERSWGAAATAALSGRASEGAEALRLSRLLAGWMLPDSDSFVAKGPLTRAPLRLGLPDCTLAAARFTCSGNPPPPPAGAALVRTLGSSTCDCGSRAVPAGSISVPTADASDREKPASLVGPLVPAVKLLGPRLVW